MSIEIFYICKSYITYVWPSQSLNKPTNLSPALQSNIARCGVTIPRLPIKRISFALYKHFLRLTKIVAANSFTTHCVNVGGSKFQCFAIIAGAVWDLTTGCPVKNVYVYKLVHRVLMPANYVIATLLASRFMTYTPIYVN